ncbi:CDC48 family AAA ATPase [Haloarchaeobius litoreus]|uniref:CDC48 family AAA ATPase n=1 Tax=Haloarchaeobius litoreus TaxID=755306 RepID=A0ABD6DRE1_9EURY|nr:CDC48 family AAA ATPase [Haloarchaeobius litoreus]
MQLTVKELRDDTARKGRATVDLAAMSRLGLMSGEHVEVRGPDGVVHPRVWPAHVEDEGTKVIHLGAAHRHAVGVSVEDTVELHPTDVDEAEALLLGIPESCDLTEPLARAIKDHLVGCVVETGDTVATPTNGEVAQDRIPVRVAGTRPGSPVAVVDSTGMKLQTYCDRTESVDDGPTYADVGGLDEALHRVRELVELPLRNPSPFDELGVDPPTGVLLHGPPGTGKTLIAEAVANETEASFVSLSGPEIVSRYYGESEEQLREVFEHAAENAPSVVFIDEIDAIAPKRGEASGDVERRIVAQLLTLMDGMEAADDVVVLGATNRLNAVDPALRRGGRFDREVEVSVPSAEERRDILEIHARGMPLADDVDLERYAERTHGFVGADIAAFTREAAMHALERIDGGPGSALGATILGTLEVTDEDLDAALAAVDPSALRELSVEVPDVSWSDVGGLDRVKRDLREAVEWPLRHPDVLTRAGIDGGQGLLLYGAPGTGKTLLARAVASESDCNLLSVRGPELLSKWVGESEQRVRELFERARDNAPAIVLFDEIDAIAAQRGRATGSGVGERVVGQLLTELDGVEPLSDVLVLATTNRPDLVDDALVRPGRLDREVHVPLPDKAARREIFAVHAADSPVDPAVDFDRLAGRTAGYVGADIAAICRRAATYATREYLHEGRESLVIDIGDFERALDAVDPSVRSSTVDQYETRSQERPTTQEGPSGFE